jgi:LysR family transcriptional regulator, glycine cleavage system transcriptional activator
MDGAPNAPFASRPAFETQTMDRAGRPSKLGTAPLPEKTLPPFATLRAFEALVRAGGVRKAAQHLGVHHSVVSRHVTHLEAWLGVPLLHWSRNQFTLTEEGERYHARISAAISEIAQATSEVAGREAGRPLRIWCSPGLSIQWLAGEIAEFEKLPPHYRVELKPSDTPANLQAHEADVNIYFHLDDTFVDPARRGLRAHLLTRPQAILAASPDLARRLSGISSPADLLNAPLLHGSQKDEWRAWLTYQGVEAPADLAGELCWNPHMALEAARLGRGVLLANRFFFERDLARGDLVEVEAPGAAAGAIGRYLFVAREDRWTTPAMVALRTFITERMRSMEEA